MIRKTSPLGGLGPRGLLSYERKIQEWLCSHNVTLWRVHETTVAVEKQCVCVCVRACVGEAMRVRTCGWVGVSVEAQKCDSVRVALLIGHATRMRDGVCRLSGSTAFFDINS